MILKNVFFLEKLLKRALAARVNSFRVCVYVIPSRINEKTRDTLAARLRSS